MKVKELKSAIKDLDDELEVYLSRDEEGNGFESLYQVVVEHVYSNDYTDELDVVHPDDLDDYDPGYVKDGVVLWP